MSLQALIFDVDGTLADTEEIHRQAFNAAFAAHDLQWNWGRRLYRDLLKVTGGRERIAYFIETLNTSAVDRTRLLERVPALHAEKTRCYARFVADGYLLLREGVNMLIQSALHAGLRLAIATTTSRANVDALVAHTMGTDALRWFETIATAETGLPKKPAPDIYLHVLDELQLHPCDAVAFEDSANGLAAAKSAGLFTIVTPTIWTVEDDLSAADLLLANLRDGVGIVSMPALHSKPCALCGEAA